MPDGTAALRVLVIGAHPDDCDMKAGGLAAKHAARGNTVRFVSATNGDAGHHELDRDALAERREREARDAADVIGIEYESLDNRDGYLQASIGNRERVIRLLRTFEPDLVLTHRLNDYHPDHRAAATLVRDAAYLVTVPNVCPDTPALNRMPVIAYLFDAFEDPSPFEPDVAVAIDGVIDRKVEMLHSHESQMYEWLPYTAGIAEEVPDDETARRDWLREGHLPFLADHGWNVAEHCRGALRDRYGRERGAEIEYAEAFEISEYGRTPPLDRLEDLFPR